MSHTRSETPSQQKSTTHSPLVVLGLVRLPPVTENVLPVPAPRGAISLNSRCVPDGAPSTAPGVMLAVDQPPGAKFSLVSLCPPMEHGSAPACDIASTTPNATINATIASGGHTRFMR